MGPPLSTGSGPTARELHDGAVFAGHIADRTAKTSRQLYTHGNQKSDQELRHTPSGYRSFRETCMQEDRQLPVREDLYQLFQGTKEQPRKRGSDEESPLELRLLGAFQKSAEDQEKDVSSFAEGVRFGVGVKLPRVPAVYTRKRKWRLKKQEDPEACLWYDDAQGADNQNSASAKELAEAVKEQLEVSVVKGQALKFAEAEARQKYGDSLVVASLGAQVKNGAKETGELTVRLLFDGTHGVPVNAGIRVRDQNRSPAAPDIK